MKRKEIISNATLNFTHEIKVSKVKCFPYANITQELCGRRDVMVYIRTNDGRAFWIEPNELQKIETNE